MTDQLDQPPRNAAGLRTDGPTLKEWLNEGNNPNSYPPPGYADLRTAADRIAEAKQRGADARPGAKGDAGPDPFVGAMVLYSGEITNGISDVHPAIVTRVHNPDVVNLHVFFDGEQPGFRSTVARVRSDARVEPPSSNRWDWPQKV